LPNYTDRFFVTGYGIDYYGPVNDGRGNVQSVVSIQDGLGGTDFYVMNPSNTNNEEVIQAIVLSEKPQLTGIENLPEVGNLYVDRNGKVYIVRAKVNIVDENIIDTHSLKPGIVYGVYYANGTPTSNNPETLTVTTTGDFLGSEEFILRYKQS